MNILATQEMIEVRPSTVAELTKLPLHTASWICKRASLGYVASKTEVETLVTNYLGLLPLPQEFETLAWRHGYPILPAYSDDFGYLHMYCMWCREFHHHGAGDGGRSPHCEWNSPWKRAGAYHLSVRGVFDRRIKDLAPKVRYPRNVSELEAW